LQAGILVSRPPSTAARPLRSSGAKAFIPSKVGDSERVSECDAARQFIRFCASAEQQAVFTESLPMGRRISTLQDHKAERAKVLPTSPDNLKKMVGANEDWWSTNRPAMTNDSTAGCSANVPLLRHQGRDSCARELRPGTFLEK